MSDVAIVIPARNAADTVGDAVQSVINAPEVGEVIVVDDGSTDGTAAAAKVSGDPRIKVLDGPATGISGALNVGFAAVTLPFIARCDADDWFPGDRLRWQRAWLNDHPDAIAVSGGFTHVFPNGRIAADLACRGEPRDVTDVLLNGQPVTHFCAWLIRTHALRQTGGAREWFRTAEDIDLQLRLAEHGHIWHVPKSSYFYRLHQDSIVHSTPKHIINFYDQQAKLFARQRKLEGIDLLQAGKSPLLPKYEISKITRSPANTAIGPLTSDIWEKFNSGKKRFAYYNMYLAIINYPLSLKLWLIFIKIH
ncbi:MAG: glycosyltransferase, partial [Pseudomonadota bacterium]